MKISSEAEFQRLLNNLKELYRRINDKENKYPKEICGTWFVSQAYEMLEDEHLRARITSNIAERIMEMASKIKLNPEIREKDVIHLNNLVEELGQFQVNRMGV